MVSGLDIMASTCSDLMFTIDMKITPSAMQAEPSSHHPPPQYVNHMLSPILGRCNTLIIYISIKARMIVCL